MPTEDFVFVGTYSEPILFGTGQVLFGKGRGISAYRFDARAGTLTLSSVAEGVRNPSYLCFDASRRFLYCVNEVKDFDGLAGGGVSAFAVDAATGHLSVLNSRPSGGTDPCHLTVDRTGRFLLVANFASGSIAVFGLQPDGALGERTALVQHEGSSIHPVRQAGPHAHAVELDASGRFVFVPDLGLDRVMIYRLDTARGTLTPHDPAFVKTRPGAGPRQLVMHPGGAHAYLINELDSTMTAMRFDAAAGRLDPFQTVSTLPDGPGHASTCAEVQVAPSGQFLYGSNRGHDSLVIYAIEAASGALTLVGHESVRGRVPRNFEISPTGAFVAAANQDSDSIVLFEVDAETGRLRATGHQVEVGTPTCVRFASLPR